MAKVKIQDSLTRQDRLIDKQYVDSSFRRQRVSCCGNSIRVVACDQRGLFSCFGSFAHMAALEGLEDD